MTHMRARKYKRIKKSSDLVPRFRESNVEIIRFIRGEVLNSVDDRGFAARVSDSWTHALVGAVTRRMGAFS